MVMRRERASVSTRRVTTAQAENTFPLHLSPSRAGSGSRRVKELALGTPSRVHLSNRAVWGEVWMTRDFYQGGVYVRRRCWWSPFWGPHSSPSLGRKKLSSFMYFSFKDRAYSSQQRVTISSLVFLAHILTVLEFPSLLES